MNIPFAETISFDPNYSVKEYIVENKGTCMGIFVFIFFVIILILVIVCFDQNYMNIKTKIKDTFESINTQQKINQPMIFPKNIKIAPGNCKPYSGCFFPSYMSNPISLKTGSRPNPPNSTDKWCEVSWRDCNAYQDCVNGKCESKIN